MKIQLTIIADVDITGSGTYTRAELLDLVGGCVLTGTGIHDDDENDRQFLIESLEITRMKVLREKAVSND